MEERAFRNLISDDRFGLELRNLAAQFGANGTGCSRYQCHVAFKKVPQSFFFQTDGLPAEQIVESDVSHLGRQCAAFHKFRESWNSFAFNAGSPAMTKQLCKRERSSGRNSD